MVISCMGLFGLAAFTANQRTREIGIRKVLGASTPQLVSMLSRQFVLLVVLLQYRGGSMWRLAHPP
jgi:ABC-type antimicrobial peptide transport system permease subunit